MYVSSLLCLCNRRGEVCAVVSIFTFWLFLCSFLPWCPFLSLKVAEEISTFGLCESNGGIFVANFRCASRCWVSVTHVVGLALVYS